jgi:hypothetical protein
MNQILVRNRIVLVVERNTSTKNPKNLTKIAIASVRQKKAKNPNAAEAEVRIEVESDEKKVEAEVIVEVEDIIDRDLMKGIMRHLIMA